MARDHLADQPEREELETDHDEQHAQHQQWALADRVAECFEHGEVDEHGPADEPEDESQSTEEMERAVAVPADEGHCEQIEEAAEVTLDAISRAAVLPRPVIDGKLGDAEAAVMGE